RDRRRCARWDRGRRHRLRLLREIVEPAELRGVRLLLVLALGLLLLLSLVLAPALVLRHRRVSLAGGQRSANRPTAALTAGSSPDGRDATARRRAGSTGPTGPAVAGQERRP